MKNQCSITKKYHRFFAIAILAVGLSSCGAPSPLQEATGATNAEWRPNDKYFKEIEFECVSAEISHRPVIQDLAEGWTAYDVVGEDGNDYIAIIQDSNKDFAALLTSDGVLYAGLIDNTLLPSHFQKSRDLRPEYQHPSDAKSADFKPKHQPPNDPSVKRPS